MTEQEFIKKAIEGGYSRFRWRVGWELLGTGKNKYIYFDDKSELNLEVILLDPKAWEAVGDMEKWGESEAPCDYCKENAGYEPHCDHDNPMWTVKMKGMVNHLVAGGTIKEYLATL